MGHVFFFRDITSVSVSPSAVTSCGDPCCDSHSLPPGDVAVLSCTKSRALPSMEEKAMPPWARHLSIPALLHLNFLFPTNIARSFRAAARLIISHALSIRSEGEFVACKARQEGESS